MIIHFSPLVWADWRCCVVVGRNLSVLHQSSTKPVVPDSRGELLSGQRGDNWFSSNRISVVFSAESKLPPMFELSPFSRANDLRVS